jgi:type VI secretion system secreted protein Hcp
LWMRRAMKRQSNITTVSLSLLALVGLLVFLLLTAGGTVKPASVSGATLYSTDETGKPDDLQQPCDQLISNSGSRAGRIYIRFEDIEAEASQPEHKNWSGALVFIQSYTTPTDGSENANKPAAFDEITIVKTIDKASPRIAEAVCKGQVFRTVEIHLTASSGAQDVTYFAYELRNVKITSYLVYAAADSQDVPQEQITLSFEQLKAAYTELDSSGNSKSRTEYTWQAEPAKP